MPVELHSPSDQVCRAGARTVASSNSVGSRVAIPYFVFRASSQTERNRLGGGCQPYCCFCTIRRDEDVFQTKSVSFSFMFRD